MGGDITLLTKWMSKKVRPGKGAQRDRGYSRGKRERSKMKRVDRVTKGK